MGPTAFGLSYDRAYSKWLPVPRAWVTPDGARFAFPQGAGIVLAKASDNAVVSQLGSGHHWQVLDAEANGVYATRTDDNTLWLLPLDGSAPRALAGAGNWQAAFGGSAYQINVSSPPGFPSSDFMQYTTTIRRFEVGTGQTSVWFRKPGHWQVAGFASDGAPIIAWTDAVTLYVVPIAGHLIELGGEYVGQSPPALTAGKGVLGDSHGIWIPATDGLYLWTWATGLRRIAQVSIAPAGGCS